MLVVPSVLHASDAGPIAVQSISCCSVRRKAQFARHRLTHASLEYGGRLVAGGLAVAIALLTARRSRQRRQRVWTCAAQKREIEQARWIHGIQEIQEKYDAFLIDLWGVVHNGSKAFPWAIAALEQLHKSGKPVIFLSNSSRRRETNIKALSRLGVERDLFLDLITSGDETWLALAEQSSNNPSAVAASLPEEVLSAQKVLTIGNGADDLEYIAGLAPRRAAFPDEADLILARGCSTLCSEDGTATPAAWAELEEALSAAARRGVPMLVANPDSVRPDGADSPMPGRLACRYLEMGGPAPHFVGKPHRAIFDTAVRRLHDAGVPNSGRICMIGDSAWHDVRGARRSGLDVVLLCSGVHSYALAVPQAPAQPERPSTERLAGFLGALLPEESPTYVASAFSWDGSSVPNSAFPAILSDRAPVVVACGLACLDLAQQVECFPHPDAKIRSKGTKWLGGGNAANTACALSKLGTSSFVLSKIGDDVMGKAILDGLQLDGVDTRFATRAQNSTSAFTTVIVDSAGSTRTCIHSPMFDELSASEVEELLASTAAPDRSAESSDRRLLGLDVDLVHFDARHHVGALALAEAASKLTAVRISIDVERPRPGLDELLPLCNAIFCNSTFPQQWTGIAGLPGALAAMLDKYPRADFVVATRGERGCLCLIRKSANLEPGDGAVASAKLPLTCCQGTFGDYHTLACDAWPLPPGAEVVDSTGAGDVFIAGVLHGWLVGQPLSLALATGSFVAMKKLQGFGARLAPDFNPSDLIWSAQCVG
mmetsp:Transcript_113426/g.219719  ORF Transcript_113426/g.219719 Transcript_113426/m.219719 type:complete len:770 (+) Transcript_113426:54-2363(+)